MTNGRIASFSTSQRGISPPALKARGGSGALRKALCILALGAGGLSAFVTAARAQQFSSEKDIVELRLGQRIKVDDGTCPAGEVKEISGTKMTAGGVVRTRKCVPRIGTKHK